MSGGQLHASGFLAHWLLRLNRVRLATWLLFLVGITLSVVAAFSPLYPTSVERQAIAETLHNPALVAMLGPAYGIDDYTIGAMTAHQMLLFTALAVALMNALLMTRATRADEELGRTEMIRALPAGRLSPLAAAFVMMAVTNGVLAAATGLGLAALGIESVDVAGSLLYGVVLGTTGMFFAAIAALFAQLTETSRGALGWTLGFVGLAYLLRAVGDVSAEPLSWLSPFGLLLRTQVYVMNIWWPVAVVAVVTIAVIGIAFSINIRRDLGAGVIAAKPGRAEASRMLNGPFGLAWRLQRPTIIGWTIGMFVLGASYGSVFNELEEFLASDLLQQMLAPTAGVSVTDQFISLITVVMAMIGSIPAILMATKLRTEENAQRTEPLLAAPMAREALIGSYITLAGAAALIMPLSAGLGLGSAAAAVMDEPIHLLSLIGASAAYSPAVLFMAGVGFIAVGCAPRWTGIPWLYLTYAFFVVYIGDLLQLPSWLARLTPFGYVPRLPVETMNAGVLVGTFVLSLLAIGTGIVGYRRRDVHG